MNGTGSTTTRETQQCATFKYPEIGSKVKCLVLKASFAQAELRILEIEGFSTPVVYRTVLKGNSVGEGVYVCDKIGKEDVIDCVVVSYGDNYIVVSQQQLFEL